MEFIVPQFIEKESKIIGPFSFKQFIFVAIAGGLCLILYFTIKSFFLFIIIAIFLAAAALSLAFLKFGGSSLPNIIKNLFIFLAKPRIYLWRRKSIPPKIMKPKPLPKKEEKEESPLKIAERSHLSKLSTFLETKAK